MPLSPTVPDACPSHGALSALLAGNASNGVSETVAKRWSHQASRTREHLRPDEVEQLITAARKQRHGHRDATLLLVMWRHGLRCAEAAALEWSAIDLKAGSIYIRRVKGSRSGEHYLEGDEIRALRRLQREQPHGSRFLWMSERGGPMSTAAIAKLVERLGAKVLPELKPHPHMLRHACGYALASKGVDTRRIQDWLGHRDIRHTAHYTALSPEALRGLWA
jgi:site-specific recombinase XerD